MDPSTAAGCRPQSLEEAGSPFRESLVNYVGEDENSQSDPDWGPQNVLSKRAVVYTPCGCYGRSGIDDDRHRHDPVELQLCNRLSQEIGEMLRGVDIFMGDESDHQLQPFHVCASQRRADAQAQATAVVSEAYLRDYAFGGALDPRYPINIKPFPRQPGSPSSDGDNLSSRLQAQSLSSSNDCQLASAAAAAASDTAAEASYVDFRNNILGIDESYIENEDYWRDGQCTHGCARNLVIGR